MLQTSIQQPSTYARKAEEQSKFGKEKIQKVATALGLNTAGKDMAALKEEIRKALDSQKTVS